MATGLLSRLAAERIGALEAKTTELRTSEAKELGRIEKDKQAVTSRTAKAIAAHKAEAAATEAALRSEFVEWFFAEAKPLVAARLTEPSYGNGLPISALLRDASERCANELGAPFGAERFLVLAYAKAKIDANPNAVFVFGAKDGLWNLVFPLGELAHNVIKAGGDPLRLHEALLRLESAISHRVLSTPPCGFGYEQARFELACTIPDDSSYHLATEAFDRDWHAADQKRQSEAYSADLDRARRFRRGEDVGEVDPATENRYRAMSDLVVGPLLRGLSSIAARALKRAQGDHSELPDDFDKSTT